MTAQLSTVKEALKITDGRPYPLGATVVNGGVNFALFSAHADALTLIIYNKGETEPLLEIPFRPEDRIGQIYCLQVNGVDPEAIEYGYRVQGPHKPKLGHLFEPNQIVIDPYARQISGRDVWANPSPLGFRAQLPPHTDFDWEGDRPLNNPAHELIVYELHVRSFTRDPSSGAAHPGTFAALIEKIPYLKSLGITAVELMPVQEFDEMESPFVNPETGQRLLQYWGYGTLGFFAPKAGYAATGPTGGQIDEFKSMVKALHHHGIEVIMDVVYNHTGERGQDGPTISFRGIDNKTYYMATPGGAYFNFSGTGNTLNCNHPVVREMIIDSLRYWVTEFHIDGFRFDLASILTRDERGYPLDNPPLIEAIAKDPILASTKLFAEAWDAAGLYQVGSFPHYNRWSEWNGKYRDAARRFLKGDEGMTGEMVQRIMGSPDLYSDRGPIASVNFINCHDGFTLHDTFTYNTKHNLANGENNRDGHNDNHSWNGGVEGPTTDKKINTLRHRLMRSACALLMVSQGIPLFHMGDEIAHSKKGNNNTYGHDNELNWLNWSGLDTHAHLLRFFKNMIAFRKAHPALHSPTFLRHADIVGSGYPDISWHGVRAWQPDWSYHSHTLAFMLDGNQFGTGDDADDFIYVALNMHWKPHVFELPRLPKYMQMAWHLFADTGRRPPHDICEPGQEIRLSGQKEIIAEPHTVIILVGR